MPLSRVLEPEVMDTFDEALDYDAMDHSEVNRVFVADLLAAGPVDGEALDLGTGPALIPIELCQKCDTCKIVAIDLAAHMLDLARNHIELEGLMDRIMLDRVDSKSLPYEDRRFAMVMSNSIIHHIPDPSSVFAEAARVSAPGGRLFFRDLLRPENEEQLWRLVEAYGGEEPHGCQMFEASLRAALTVDEVRAIVAELGFAPETVQPTSDRHWTFHGLTTTEEKENV